MVHLLVIHMLHLEEELKRCKQERYITDGSTESVSFSDPLCCLVKFKHLIQHFHLVFAESQE